MSAPTAEIRDAATAVVIRRDGDAPRVLMGQRGRGASFMPNKFVFPGGAIDPDDRGWAPAAALRCRCEERLSRGGDDPTIGMALALAAVRETYEETGLRIGARSDPAGGAAGDASAAEGWRAFLESGASPGVDRLRFFFRAVTPPGLPRRFDARFFLAPADAILDDLDDFGRASTELSHLTWAPLDKARTLDLPFITSVVLAELQAWIDRGADFEEDRPIPFFRHDESGSHVDPL